MTPKLKRAYQSVIVRAMDQPLRGRAGTLRSMSAPFLEYVADTAHGMDQLAVERIVYLGAQPAHVHLDHIGVAVEVDIPDFLRDQRPREDLARASQQQREKLEFLWREIEGFSGACHAVPDGVELEVGHLERGSRLRPAAAQDGAQPREELRERERLDEIVVGTELETLHAVANGIARCQEQDRRLDLMMPQLLDDAPAVASGQHHVQNDGVVGARPRKVRAILTVVRHVDHEAILLEAARQIGGGLVLVLDDEELHGRTALSGPDYPDGSQSSFTDGGSERSGLMIPKQAGV